MEKENNLLIVKLSDPALISSLVTAVQNGFPLLIENVGEDIDPILGLYFSFPVILYNFNWVLSVSLVSNVKEKKRKNK